MIRSFDKESKKLVGSAAVAKRGWIHVTEPTEEDLDRLAEAGLPRSYLAHALDVDEGARIDHHPDGASLVVLRVPLRQGHGHDLPYRSESLGVVVQGGRLVTIARKETHLCDALATREGTDPSRPWGCVLVLLMMAAEAFLEDLRRIERAVDRLEDQLQSSLQNRQVLALLKYQKALTHFATALDSNGVLLDRLEKDERVELDKADREFLEDVRVELRQAKELTNVAASILGDMMDAFASIISNNLNVVMKALTSLTIILTFPMLVAIFYGVNVRLPGQDLGYAFFLLVGISAALGAVVALAFWRRNWL